MRISKYLACFLVLCFLHSLLFGQTHLKGSVVDKQTKEPIAGAVVVVSGKRVATSDTTGAFTINMEHTISSLTVVRLGYARQMVTLPPNTNSITVELELNATSRPIVVEGATTQEDEARPAAAISTLTPYDLQRGPGISLPDAINLIPGVQMQARTPFGGQRLIIRGYGGNSLAGLGTNFNGTGYKVYLDGVPVTDATGLTIMDDIDNSNLGGVSVIKGPASTLYGNGIAGVVPTGR